MSAHGVTIIGDPPAPPAKEKRRMDCRRLMKQPVFKLAVGGFVVGIILLYVLVVPAAHDPLWWRHVGIPEKKDFVWKGPIPTTRNPTIVINKGGNGGVVLPTDPPAQEAVHSPVKLNPQNGTEYFADYDVSKVVIDPEPPLTQQHPKYLFHYVDPKTSKWPLMYLSNKPKVVWVPNFMTPEECDAIIAEASKTMQRSQVVPYKGNGDQNTVSDVRTSSQTWLATTSGVAAPIVKRIFELTGFPEGSSEMLQVLRYEKGEKYDAHLDYFDPQLYGPQSSNRAVTVFLYLSTVEEGGYTQFPRADGKPPDYDFKSCIRGLKVRPIKGTIAFFYDMKPNGEYDDTSLHGGCKPVVGTKWGGTLWLRVPV
jgi:prolyl 4-hydroxylase